jgi:hypothetical protein
MKKGLSASFNYLGGLTGAPSGLAVGDAYLVGLA